MDEKYKINHPNEIDVIDEIDQTVRGEM